MTNAPSPGIGDFRDIESLNYFAAGAAAGTAAEDLLLALRTSSP
jgi:hypothetical protein